MRNSGGVAIIGHSLAAPENRLPFSGMDPRPTLIAPRRWKSPGTRHEYALDAQEPRLIALETVGLRHNVLFRYRNLDKTLDRIRPSLIYLWEEPWSLPARQVSLWARRNGIPWIFFSAENRPKKMFWPFTSLLRKTFSTAAAAIVPTREIADNLRAQGYAGVTHVIPLWSFPHAILPEGKPMTMAYIGRFIPLKRIDLVLRAAALLPELQLRLIGDGPEEGALRRLASRLNLDQRVSFQGQVPHGQIGEALRGCSMLILPTAETPRRAEQFGKAVLDGLWTGLPVLVSQTGHLSAWAREFSTVIPVECASPQTLADGISRAMKNPPGPALRMAMREKAQECYGPRAASLLFSLAFQDTLSRNPAD